MVVWYVCHKIHDLKPGSVSSTMIVSLLKDNDTRELLVTKKIWVQLLHPWVYCTMLIVVHRCHSWVGLLVCLLPWAACVVLCGTVKASPQGGGFQVALEQSSSLLGLFFWHSIILCRLFISTPASVCPHLDSLTPFIFLGFFSISLDQNSPAPSA